MVSRFPQMGDRGKVPASIKLARDAIRYLSGKAASSALGFIGIAIFISVTDLASYGVFATGWAAVIFSASLASGWARQGVLRHGSIDERGLAPMTLASMGLIGLLGAISGLAAWSAYVNTLAAPPAGYRLAATWVTLGASGFSALAVLQSVLQVRLRAMGFSVSEVLRTGLPILLIVGLVAAVHRPVPVHALFAVSTLGVLAALVYCIALVRVDDRLSQGACALKALWWYGWPMSVWLGAATSVNFADRYVLSAYVDLSDVGLYSATYDLLVKVSSLLTLPVAVALHPRFMQAWDAMDRYTALALRRLATRVVIGIGAALGVPIVLARRYWLGAVGVEEAVGWELPALIYAGVLAWNVGLVTHKVLEAAGQTRALMAYASVSAVMNVVANLALVPIYGLTGAAASTFATGCLYLIAVAIHSRVTLGRLG